MPDVEVLGNVERIRPPSLDELHRDYILQQRPVIITGLFDGQPIRDLDSADAFRAALPDLPLMVQPNYMRSLLARGKTAEPATMTLAAFLDLLAEDPRTDLYCVEYPTPESLSALISPPEYCALNDPGDMITLTFVAHPGNSAHLHYDGDQRNVLMYQVFGRKRYVVIHPREVRKVDAVIDPNMQRTSALFLENFAEPDKLAFLRYTNAWDCLLEPGETLLMPMMAWHYIEYVDTSLSVSYRLGRNRYNRFLAEQIPIPSTYLQALAVRFADVTEVETRHRDTFSRIVEACGRPYGHATQRAEVLEQLCVELYEEMYPEPDRRMYSLHDLRRRDVAMGDSSATTERSTDGSAQRSGFEGSPSPMTWQGSHRVRLPDGVAILTRIEDRLSNGRPSSVLLSRHGNLETELPLDERFSWVLDFLRALSETPRGLPLADLAARCGAELPGVQAIVTELYKRGWLELA